MKLAVLALDYDGTITGDDRPHASVLSALADARRSNVTVILATSRNLDDLRRVAGDLRFVDGVVAENRRWSIFQAPATERSWHH